VPSTRHTTRSSSAYPAPSSMRSSSCRARCVCSAATVPGANVLLGLYEREWKHLVAVTTAALSTGIEERRAQWAEDQGRLVADVLRAALVDLGHDLVAGPRASHGWRWDRSDAECGHVPAVAALVEPAVLCRGLRPRGQGRALVRLVALSRAARYQLRSATTICLSVITER
jgi:hypothetical protein